MPIPIPEQHSCSWSPSSNTPTNSANQPLRFASLLPAHHHHHGAAPERRRVYSPDVVVRVNADEIPLRRTRTESDMGTAFLCRRSLFPTTPLCFRFMRALAGRLTQAAGIVGGVREVGGLIEFSRASELTSRV